MHSDELTRPRTHTLDESLLVDSESSDRSVVDFLGSTPGRMALVTIVLVAALLAVGVAASMTVSDRQDRLETLQLHTEPLADAAQEIYDALSFANTTSATAFLSGGLEPNDVRNRYDAAIGQASAGLVTASNGVSPNDIHSLRLLTDLSNQLAVYTGIIATARANDRAGHPIGVAYLGESSALMQQAILPDAEQLYRTQANAVVGSGRSIAPTLAIVGAAALVLGLLVLAQISLARRSHRRLNPGLVVASALVAVLAAWVAAAGLVSTRAAAGGHMEGGKPLDNAVTARILAQQARADEILGLLKHGSDTESDSNFHIRTTELAQLLDENQMHGAVDALNRWVQRHVEAGNRLADGDFSGAVAITRANGPQHSTPEFTRLNDALSEEITQLRTRQREGIMHAYTALDMLPVAALAIGVVAALAVAAGIAPRLSEYH